MEITFKILWTDFAINQLKDIFDYHLIKASSSIAQKLIQRIIDATIILENNPKSGRKEDLLNTAPHIAGQLGLSHRPSATMSKSSGQWPDHNTDGKFNRLVTVFALRLCSLVK